MEIGNIEGATKVFGAPDEWGKDKRGECCELPVLERDGWMISEWVPTAEERQRIAAGYNVHLWVMGPHPVVSLTVAEPVPVEAFEPSGFAFAKAETLKPCRDGYGHGGQWCGPEYDCWLDPRSRGERKGHAKDCSCLECR